MLGGADVVRDRRPLDPAVLRDCFLRGRRFEDCQRHLGIARPVLADRLQKLVDHFVLAKVPYQKRPLRCEYRLTSKGQDLYPVVMAIVHWGDAHMADKKGPPLQHRHRRCGQLFSPLLACSECGEPLEPHQVEAEPGPGASPGALAPPTRCQAGRVWPSRRSRTCRART